MKQKVIIEDLGLKRYKEVWDYQEELLKKKVELKKELHLNSDLDNSVFDIHYLLLVEHYPVYTLGKNGKDSNVLISEHLLKAKGIDFFRINRGGDITFHGPGQLVGYPILDLEKFTPDIGKYLRNLEEVIIKTIADFGIKGERSAGETGVWIDTGKKGKERKICAMGVKCSRWVTMHGWALNVNTDLSYFENIIPCGIIGKQVTSMQKEIGSKVSMEEVKDVLKEKFSEVFGVEIIEEDFI